MSTTAATATGGEKDGETFLATYDAGASLHETLWAVSDLFDTLEKRFNGARVVLMADCCHSGALAEAAGKQKGGKSYACFGSSPAEAISTATWSFSESLLDVLER